MYPPNTTLILKNPCQHLEFYALGEITKFVVESNYGYVTLGNRWIDEFYTKEVVIKRNARSISLNNSMDRVEIQESIGWVNFKGNVAEHIDVKKASGSFNFFYDSSTQ